MSSPAAGAAGAAAPGRAEGVVLEAYRRYHSPRYIHPDPLEVVRRYTHPSDREVVALICASLALGRVRGILDVCADVLARLDAGPAAGQGPAAALEQCTLAQLRERFDGFVYRFFGREEISHFLYAIGESRRRHGSLEHAFLGHFSRADSTVLAALDGLSQELSGYAGGIHGLLLAQVGRGSAAKRWHLFLRWVVRSDEVDPGGWTRVPRSRLVVPMDTHMHRICTTLGILSRKTPDRRAALEVTEFFRRLDSADPVRFDFSLTRLGIHPDAGRERPLLLGADGGAFCTQT
ncbi:MAG: TIGR02757 family protein [Spirochaetaceae bacterium]